MYNPYADAPFSSLQYYVWLARDRLRKRQIALPKMNCRDKGETAIYLAALHRLLAEKPENA